MLVYKNVLQKHQLNKSLNQKCYILCYAFCHDFWAPSQTEHILSSGAFFLCIQSMFTIITFGSERALIWIIIRYSYVLQTLVII